MQDDRLTWLFFRYFEKTASPDERDELMMLLRNPDHESQVKLLMEKAYQDFIPEAEIFSEVQSQKLFARIVDSQDAITPPLRVVSSFPWKRMVAAAAVLLLVATGGYLWYHNNRTTVITANHPLQDIAPGQNKAILTLADGAAIALDSADNQVIQHGNISISQHNGHIQYSAPASSAQVSYNKLTTPKGGQYQLTLPDGSRVWLNSASSLTFPTAFNKQDRVVKLQGQGYFEIAPNAKQPFKVQVNNLEVQVLGTQFDIMAYEDESSVNTTLLQGTVKVKGTTSEQMLRPGQQAVDTDRVTAWKNGRFIFNDANLATILREISRWYDVDIVYKTTPGNATYGGAISRNLNLSDVLKALEENGDNHHFSIENRKVIVLP
jgi:transmembrane sensor